MRTLFLLVALTVTTPVWANYHPSDLHPLPMPVPPTTATWLQYGAPLVRFPIERLLVEPAPMCTPDEALDPDNTCS